MLHGCASENTCKYILCTMLHACACTGRYARMYMHMEVIVMLYLSGTYVHMHVAATDICMYIHIYVQGRNCRFVI